ncbi:tyrosine-type recombinase/integrase [Hydrocoleum sp. CS-953]|uniref:tyrosine-type recombinase/integrase n=1 Tax=Hydrocoleum sp. CS-953 TaxID=1671698 RepID=UPI001AEFD80A|nr:tyrosine-type recombinase/integrase [Hydrocoleum sp. CS-953]
MTHVSYRTVNKDWKKLTQNHPLLEGVRLHDLRHTFATERVGLIRIQELKALIGHKSITTTLPYQKVT